jgi:hypothetical protein
VDVLNATDLRGLYVPDTRGTNGNLAITAWSVDGSFLYAAGRFSDNKGNKLIRRWADAGRGAFQDLEGQENTITALEALPEGGLAFGSAVPAWEVIDAAGKSLLSQGPAIADFRVMAEGFRVGAGGTTVTFAFEPLGRRPARFSIPSRRLVLDPPPELSLAPPRLSAPGLEVTGWKDTTEPKLNGQPLALEPFEGSRSLSVTPDGQSFLLGTAWYLRFFGRNGRERWAADAPGYAWGVNLTEDGRLAVAAFGDGTIRWYRADNGKELLALFPHADGKRWVLWTPSGYYDASVDGEDLIGWHVNNGPDKEADFFSAGHFRDRFRKPEVIDLILETLDEAEALHRAGIRPEAERPPEVQREEQAVTLHNLGTLLSPAGYARALETVEALRSEIRDTP